MEKIKSLLIHPFLFCAYPILLLWSKNIKDVPFSEVLPVLAFSFCFTAISIFILRLILRDYRKAAIITTVFLLLFFSYGHVYNMLQEIHIGGLALGRHRNLVLAWPVILTASFLYMLLMRRDRFLNGLTGYLNIVGIVLVSFSFVQAALFRSETASVKKTVSEKHNITRTDKNPMPDVYYIILDSYTRADVLKEALGYDNSEFIDKLKNMGFYVAAESKSNYSWTIPSLASSLNMEYLKRTDDTEEMRYNNKVSEIFRGLGYKIITIPSFHKISADVEYLYGPPKTFLYALADTTWLYPFSFFGLFNSIYDYQRKCVLYQFDRLEEIPGIREPTFTFAHIPVPHVPYIFDKDGKPLRFNALNFFKVKNVPEDLWHQKQKILYIEQLMFVNRKTLGAIEKILNRSSLPPIIVVQGDHGPFIGLNSSKITDVLIRQKISILNAYYFPGEDRKLLYDNVSPVNSFRIVFKKYFGRDYELLPDISYYSGLKDCHDFIKIPE